MDVQIIINNSVLLLPIDLYDVFDLWLPLTKETVSQVSQYLYILTTPFLYRQLRPKSSAPLKVENGSC